MESCSADGPNVFFQQVIYPTNKNHDITIFLDAMLGVRLVPLAPKIKVADIPAERLQSGGPFFHAEIFRTEGLVLKICTLEIP